jgi:Tol biopolymer transport system component
MKKLLLSFLLLLLFLSMGTPARGKSPAGLADSPWPMYQHDPQHTGRSPFLGPQTAPRCIWSHDFEDIVNGGIAAQVIDQEGNLILSVGNSLIKFNPSTLIEIWRTSGSYETTTPLIAADGSIYRGFLNAFGKYSSAGALEWSFEIDWNATFGSDPTFGPDGNILVVHDALISTTPDGQGGWIYPYYDISYESPAVGKDGVIYASATHDLAAFTPDGYVSWTLTTTHGTVGRTPVIGQDGTIYLLNPHGYLYAINPSDGVHPSGSVKWEFIPGEVDDIGSAATRNVSLGPDDMLYYVEAGDLVKLYAVNPGGVEEWTVPLLRNTLTNAGGIFYGVISVDRAGNAFLCHTNSSCYGVNPDGELLWEYKFPMVDSIIQYGMTQLLAADGLVYFGDNRKTLYAFGDPGVYPVLNAGVTDFNYQVEAGSPSFTATLPITSSVASISYTVSISATNWLTVSQSSGFTPGNLTVKFDPGSLAPDLYQAVVTVQHGEQACTAVRIPIKLEVTPRSILVTQPVYLPLISSGYHFTPGHFSKHLLYFSKWFTDNQFATIEYNGHFRTPLAHNLTEPISMVYSPDGLKVAMVVWGPENLYEIRVLNTKTGQPMLQIGQGHNTFPSWSPDSQRLVFLSTRDDREFGQIYQINLDGSGLKRLTTIQTHKAEVYWSPLNDKIAFSSSPPDYGIVNSTYIMNQDGSNLHPLAFSPKHWLDTPAGWSPDGRFLLINAQEYNIGSAGLWSYDIQTGAFTMLLDAATYSGLAIWSPDGSRIVFVSCQYAGQCKLKVANADGSGIVDITNNLTEISNISWSGDGQWIVFDSKPGQNIGDNFNLFVARADGTGLQQITTNIENDKFPFWAP